MKLITISNSKILFEKAASIVASEIDTLSKKEDIITLGLVGGRSVEKIYEILAKKELLAWKKVHFFLVDERNVPNNNINSNYNLIYKHLIKKLLDRKQISKKNIHPINTKLSPNLAKREYAKELEKYKGYFDILIVSSGEDNHIAAIFPEKKYPKDEKFTFFNDSPKPPKERFTATPVLVSKTKICIVIFLGQEKKYALNHFLNKTNKKTLPERTLQKIKNLIILTNQ